MTRNIEELNRQIIACHMLDKAICKGNNTAQPVIDKELVKSVMDYHRYFGSPRKFAVLRGLARTRKFVRTVCPK
jgi:hypothetical protein